MFDVSYTMHQQFGLLTWGNPQQTKNVATLVSKYSEMSYKEKSGVLTLPTLKERRINTLKLLGDLHDVNTDQFFEI